MIVETLPYLTIKGGSRRAEKSRKVLMMMRGLGPGGWSLRERDGRLFGPKKQEKGRSRVEAPQELGRSWEGAGLKLSRIWEGACQGQVRSRVGGGQKLELGRSRSRAAAR